MARTFQSGAAKLHPGDHQQYESQHRTVPGGRSDRGIPGGEKRTGVSDHLFQSGLELRRGNDILAIVLSPLSFDLLSPEMLLPLLYRSPLHKPDDNNSLLQY